MANISDLPDDLLTVIKHGYSRDHRSDRPQIVYGLRCERLIVCRNPLLGEDAIGLAVGQVIGDHKMKKHFDLTITEKCFSYARRTDNITAEAALDGLYVIRTCVSSERMNSDHVVLTYKSLAKVERSKSAKQKDATRRTPEDLPVQSFRDLLKCMATLTRNSIRFESSAPEFHQLTESTPLQRRALELLSAHA